MNKNWNTIRKEEFPSLREGTHLKSAGGSPLSRTAYKMALKYFNEMLFSGDLFWDKYLKQVKSLKKSVAQYINSDESEIAFLINTSSCLNIVAHFLNKGEILYPEEEFPTSIHIFKRLNYACKKITHRNHNYPIDSIEKKIGSKTNYIIHSHVQYLTGFRQDLDKLGTLCEKRDIFNIINATQSFGAYPIDVREQNIDILVSSGLKWACAGYGIGVLYIRKELFEKFFMPFSSWLSVEDPFLMDNQNLSVVNQTRSIDALGGSPHVPNLLALLGSLKLIKRIGKGDIQWGIEQMEKRIIELTKEFVKRLRNLDLEIITPIDENNLSGIVTVRHSKAKEIYKQLSKIKIYISLRNFPQQRKKTLLRFSFNFYNNYEDIEKTIKVLENIL